MSKRSVICTTPREHGGRNGVRRGQPEPSGSGVSVQRVQEIPPPSPAGPRTVMAPSKPSKKSAGHGKESEEYRQRRERNNMAVRKSRLKSKQKAQDTQQRVEELKEENERLEAKIKLLSKELSVLKDLFLEHAHSFSDNGHPPFTENTASGQGSNMEQ
uniref:CCAAT/enhancer-binding protein gamma-like n=1 Tax=Pristiophorus japonicus TaxID=55135 RepID=UPI00398E932F